MRATLHPEVALIGRSPHLGTIALRLGVLLRIGRVVQLLWEALIMRLCSVAWTIEAFLSSHPVAFAIILRLHAWSE